jgi:UDPglucose--hexose-1-phosphate uridylyltransferase
MLVDYAQYEIRMVKRVVVSNAYWVTVVRFWAVWPFEGLLTLFEPVRRLAYPGEQGRILLASINKELLTCYDNLFKTSFPYSLGWHGAPFVEGDHAHWQRHAHFLSSTPAVGQL